MRCYRYEKPARWKGIPAAAEPIQSEKNLPAAFRLKNATVTPLAHYSVTAVVLSRDRYRFDPGAEFSPVDLALGWGSMSIAEVINGLKISQGGRFYEYAWKNEAPLDPTEIARHSANTHCIPANTTVRRKLLNVRRHQWVKLEGLLVEIANDDGGHWRSSLTREDTGGGACELLWVTGVEAHNL